MNNSYLVETSNDGADRLFYLSMRKSIEGKADDLRDFKRMTVEASDLEKEIKRLQDDILHHHETLAMQKALCDKGQYEVDDTIGLVDTIRRWSEDAVRVVDKKIQIKQKILDLKATCADSTRDLKTVDRQIAEMREEKEMMSTKILRLNKEMSDLNHKISEVSTSVGDDLCKVFLPSSIF